MTEYDTAVHKGEMQMPSVWFIYDISPIMATITESRRSFAHLLTRLCAVVGGVFAVTGEPIAVADKGSLPFELMWQVAELPCEHRRGY